MKTKFLRHALALVPALFLAACGGGGGDSSGNAATAVQLAITSANSQAVAAESLEASASYEAAAGGASLLTGVEVDGGGAANPLLLAKATSQLLAKVPAGPSLATGVSATETLACSSGTLTVSYSVASTSGVLAAGDSMSFTANNCTETVGTETMRMNGTMSITILSGTFNASGAYPRSVSMQTSASNFTVVQGGETMVANGDVTIDLTQTSFSDAKVTLKSSRMSSKVGSHAVTLKGYTHTVTETSSGATIQITATVETNNSRLGTGTVSYQVTTTTPIVVNSAGQVTAGVLKATGASGSNVVLTATGADSFTVQVDADGNGTYESSNTVTRTALAGLL
ncbi:hypothetical protein H8N03_08260 [Ramlibacter sp. USB13]|uniref:Big-1 domain-containing protein n=1 Tax=Ramlibacter cellulosilyticus TaxID=2764187 RepID=A0A923SAM3_9BURK|nr:hypothetical protein [Ramlibacter cellulosilyticus]MBC5782936.1 hypothetical protein [Ramlibacter cellulosilyticus]